MLLDSIDLKGITKAWTTSGIQFVNRFKALHRFSWAD